MKQQLIDAIIKLEGGFVSDSADSGGTTKYGITEAVARAYGYLGDMSRLPYETAFAIYEKRYWQPVRGDELMLLSSTVCEEMVDTAVNMGVATSIKFLQRCLRVFNDDDTIKIDGVFGAMTLYALKKYLDKRDQRTLCKALNSLQGERYILLATARKKDRRFVYGWLTNRVAG